MKIALIFILFNILISSALTQGPASDNSKIKFQKASLVINKNGSIYLQDEQTRFMEMKLRRIDLVEYNSTNTTNSRVISNETYENRNWTTSSTVDTADLKTNNFTVKVTRNSNYLNLNFSLANNTYPVNNTGFQYHWNYYFILESFLPYTFTYNTTTTGVNKELVLSNGMNNIRLVNVMKYNLEGKSLCIENDGPLIINSDFYNYDNNEKNGDLNLNEISAQYRNGGDLSITQPKNSRFPQALNIRLLALNELNANLRVNQNNLDIVKSDSPSKSGTFIPSITKVNKGINIASHVFNNKLGNTKISQNATVYISNSIEYNFTNSSRLSSGLESYILGPGPNVIYRGDIVYSLKIDGLDICRKNNTKMCPVGYGEESQSLVFPLAVNFSDEKFGNVVNKGDFLLYANMISEDPNAKILSIKNFNQYSQRNLINRNNLIYVTTNAFNGSTTIQLLFKFLDVKQKSLLGKFFYEDENLVFENAGGKVLFTNQTWDMKDDTLLDNMLFKKMQVDSISEFDANKTEIRKYSLRNLYYTHANGTKNNTFMANSLNITEDSSTVNFVYEPIIQDMNNFTHTFVEQNGNQNTQIIPVKKGDIYVTFNMNWTPCFKRTNEDKLAKECNDKQSDRVRLSFYLNEMTQVVDDRKPPTNDTQDDKPEEDLEIKYRALNGNYNNSNINELEELDDITEALVNFDFSSNRTTNVFSGAFIVSYSTRTVLPPANHMFLYIIIGILIAIFVAAVVSFILKRQEKRRLSESRLEEFK